MNVVYFSRVLCVVLRAALLVDHASVVFAAPPDCAGQYKGQRLIEVGTGPTLHTVLSACAHYQEIVLSDYTEVNRRELEKWLRSEEGHFDWRAHMQFVCELEGTRYCVEDGVTLTTTYQGRK